MWGSLLEAEPETGIQCPGLKEEGVLGERERGSVGREGTQHVGGLIWSWSCSPLIPRRAPANELYHSWSYLGARKLAFILIFKALIVSQPLAISLHVASRSREYKQPK